jgi:hypothetical protein
MSDAESDEEDEQQTAAPASLLQSLLSGSAESESEDEQDPKEPAGAAPPSAPEAASGSNGDAAQAVAEEGASTGGLLPSAMDLLFDGGLAKPDFLRVDGPEFDASKHFKPPAVTHAELAGVNDRTRVARSADEDAPGQRYHQEEQHGRASGQVRMRGSVCFETDDERGRRVVYGAHNMLKADPWSNCNPNLPMRGGARRARMRSRTAPRAHRPHSYLTSAMCVSTIARVDRVAAARSVHVESTSRAQICCPM